MCMYMWYGHILSPLYRELYNKINQIREKYDDLFRSVVTDR